jgi:hypothetical protein
MLRNDYLMRLFLETDASSLRQNFQSGPRIQDHILADRPSTAVFYLPGAVHTSVNPQNDFSWSIFWRYLADHMGWTEQEILQQFGTDPRNLTTEATKEVLKKAVLFKISGMLTSKLEAMETHLVKTVPIAAQMEASGGTKPYNLWAFLNERTNGLMPGWTTVMGINPATYPWWDHLRYEYDYQTPLTTAGDGLWDALDQAELKLKYRTPPNPMGEAQREVNRNQLQIITGHVGELFYKRMLRNKNDRLLATAKGNDPKIMPMWGEHSVRGFQSYDEAAVFDDGASGLTTYDLAPRRGPRFHVINPQFLKMIFFAGRYFYRKPVEQPPGMIDSYRQWMVSWYNMVCRSRKHAGVVIYPKVYDTGGA